MDKKIIQILLTLGNLIMFSISIQSIYRLDEQRGRVDAAKKELENIINNIGKMH